MAAGCIWHLFRAPRRPMAAPRWLSTNQDGVYSSLQRHTHFGIHFCSNLSKAGEKIAPFLGEKLPSLPPRKKCIRCLESLSSLGIMGEQPSAPLKSFNTIVRRWSGGFRGLRNTAKSSQSLGQLYGKCWLIFPRIYGRRPWSQIYFYFPTMDAITMCRRANTNGKPRERIHRKCSSKTHNGYRVSRIRCIHRRNFFCCVLHNQKRGRRG